MRRSNQSTHVISDTNHYDVLIVGAGISGIGMGCHLTRNCSTKTFAILESRNAIGGTWDLFRYPGIRSDSDMFTFGYNFRPWTGAKLLADGQSIKQYVEDTANEYGLKKRIQFGISVKHANWCSQNNLWTLKTTDATGTEVIYTARFLVGCTGYYNYETGYKPVFKDEDSFKGKVIHPQHWPADLDYEDKKVVVIGSGATAITLVPSLAKKASHVTMLQRSPTYLLPLPSIDPVAVSLQKYLPKMTAYHLTRARNILLARTFFESARRRPKLIRSILLRTVKQQLNGKAELHHFEPTYAPWDQRLCVVSDGDLFKTIKSGNGSIVTDYIDRFLENGIKLKSGKTIEADIIVTATGLDLQMLGGIDISVDDRPFAIGDTLIYKNVLVEGLPNAGMVFGYTNISWTLKADIASEYVCRLINHMDKHGYQSCIPIDTQNSRTQESFLGSLDSGYIRRGDAQLPRQGRHGPWKGSQNYLADLKTLRYGSIEDGVLNFDGHTNKQKISYFTKMVSPIRSIIFGS